MAETVKEYLARIGQKGGQASKGTQKAKERAKKASIARWNKKQTEGKRAPEQGD
jgi:hypothetical protein